MNGKKIIGLKNYPVSIISSAGFLFLIKIRVTVLKIFDLSLKINGFPLREAKAQLAAILAIPDAAYPDFINSKKQEIVAYHLQHNTFYKQLTGKYTTWENLPIMTKKILQRPLSERLSIGYTPKNVYCNKTSGSSGTPFIFAKDKMTHALTWASNCYRFGWYGIDFNTSLQARFYGIPLDFLGNRKERFKDFLGHRYRFPIFDLSDTALEKFLQHFRNSPFDYINGYTSAIVQFAKFLERNDHVLSAICPSLKVCIVTSEMLFASDRELLEKQFGIPVVNEYGASELDLIAFENPKGQWQVNTETLYVEILDDQDRVVPHGTEGRIVITSLFNTAHPFIRYDIGDIGALSVHSTPKKVILEKLVGRTNDFALLPSGKKVPGLAFYYVTKSIIEDSGMVKEFVIRQIAADRFEIDYVSTGLLQEAMIQKMELALTLYLEPGLHFDFIRKNSLNRTHRGKLKQFTSLIAK